MKQTPLELIIMYWFDIHGCSDNGLLKTTDELLLPKSIKLKSNLFKGEKSTRKCNEDKR